MRTSKHKSYEEIRRELAAARALVPVGRTYAHFKDPSHLVTVIALGVREATDEPCVIYREVAAADMVFVRDLSSWLEEPVAGTPRFRLVDEPEGDA